jgi:hypothetical protein
MIKMVRKKGQQEMVGFVLIVVIVIIGVFIFLIFSMGQNKIKETDIANNILYSLLRTTVDCSLVDTSKGNVKFLDMRELFKISYEDKMCSNNQRLAFDVLNETLTEILDEILVLEPTISAYQLDFIHSDAQGTINLLRILKGSCNGTIYGSSPHPISITSASKDKLEISLTICLFPQSE